MKRALAAHDAAAHFDRPANVAALVATLPAVIVCAEDTDHAATLAIAVARAAATNRRVALGDLAGNLGAIYALAGGEDAPGLAECFRDGLTMNDIARPVPGQPSLFVLPAGAGVRAEPSLASAERWTRLIRGFGEAGGLLVLVVPERSPLIGVLAGAGAQLLYGGAAASAPHGVPLAATIGAARRSEPVTPVPGTVGPWHVVVAGAAAAVIFGWGAVALTNLALSADGAVVLAPALRVGAGDDTATTAPDTVTIIERTDAGDQARLAPFAVEVVAASTASNAFSLLRDAVRKSGLPAPTVTVVAVARGPGRTSRWHKVMFGAWHDVKSADSAVTELRRNGVVAAGGGAVVRVPYAILLADSTAAERARAVMDVWRAKGIEPYALTQDDGTMRVYAGAFETVAQAVTMAAMVRAAGGAAIVAHRTGRPD